MAANPELALACINSIRSLSIDGVQKANSGHPGLPLGAAPMAYALWNDHLRHSPKNPKWFNRDRFILSAGHGSMLLYSLLYLTGYGVTLDDLKSFRQLHSITPGHPENFLTPGVEMATGPLGQGFGQAVGFAIAEEWLAATFNRPDHTLVDHHTFVIASDGDLMEGLSYEAASLAGHLKLSKLIVLFDDNDITLDGPASLSVSENHELRFQAAGWDVQKVDGMDPEAVSAAITAAKSSDKPSLIMCKTIIGFGSPNKQGTQKAHGSPLGPDEVKLTKEALGLPADEQFYVAPEALAQWRSAESKGESLEKAWNDALDAYSAAHPGLAATFKGIISGDYGTEWVAALPSFGSDVKQATRKASETVINTIAAKHPALVGGSADLSESTLTTQKGIGRFTPENRAGRNIFFGVREHAMIAAVNGLTLNGLKGYGGSFFCFTDYCRPSIRLAALMQVPSIYVFTHDSIGLGEDGPTHQPVEHLTAMRAIPNLTVIRPCDGNETAAAWKVALESTGSPTLLVLSRQNLPTLSPQTVTAHPAEKGAYVLQEASAEPKVILIGTGSEVSICVDAKAKLEAEGIPTRVVSMPSWELFANQDDAYKASVFPAGVKRVSIEAGSTMAWPRFSDAQIGLDRFGLSAPAPEVYAEFGITAEHAVEAAKALLS